LAESRSYRSEFIVYDDGFRGWTFHYVDIARLAGAFAARLRQHGMGKGDTVTV
jgi:acyl-CoA synthetase (AMP-forming)/AMP-acid ligase II